MSTLFVVATPIGNLEDASTRSLRVLGEASLVVAEDTRLARTLLQSKGIRARLLSYNEHNRQRRIPQILEAMSNGDVALICDAGTPAISDPGAELVAAARAAGHLVTSVPGPSALAAAISISGLRLPTFRFQGFLPRSPGELRRLFGTIAASGDALVAFEAPTRLRRTLKLIDEAMPDRQMALCREMTKIHEEVFTGSASQALGHFLEPRGEFVLLVEGSAEESAPTSLDAVAEDALRMKEAGLDRRQATQLLIARHAISRRQAYTAWLAAFRG